MRLIEAGFPCHQVGAETQRERDTGKSPPPNRLHVWWARRPLTPSRAAILASLLPADTDPDWFLRQLGIEKRVVEINGVEWTLYGKVLDKVGFNENNEEVLKIDDRVLRNLTNENQTRKQLRDFLHGCGAEVKYSIYANTVSKWLEEVEAIPIPEMNFVYKVKKVCADPSFANEKKDLGKATGYRFPGDAYGYRRAFENSNLLPMRSSSKELIILDPTSGGGSIPFEALRLGHKVIANELNPVASVILHATLEYPDRWGILLKKDIEYWGNQLLESADEKLSKFFPDSQNLTLIELSYLKEHLKQSPECVLDFNTESIVDYLYCRQVTCPHCNGDAPLLNTCWLSKQSGKQWGVKIIPDGKPNNGTVRFETYRIFKEKGPKGQDPGFATVNRGVGHCIHCKQAIDADEIKSQARGESPTGKWKDRLYCVVAVRFQPKLDKDGKPQRFKSGAKKGEIKTEKVRFFRPPNKEDLSALKDADKRLKDNWDQWDEAGLIPTETIPLAHKTKEPLRVGMTRWCDMFTSRQLLGHLTLVEELNRLKPQIIDELGEDKGKAVVTYLQFAIDKGVDYNSRLTTWENTRCIVKHVFARHDFSITWTFGEMIFSGRNSGFSWCLSQILDAYNGLAILAQNDNVEHPDLTIYNKTAAHIPQISEKSVDLICMDPPYYNNVQYAELSYLV